MMLLACGRVPRVGASTDDKLATASEKDCGFVQNIYGQRVSWKQSLPVKLYIDPSVPTDYDAVLQAAAKQWEDAMGRSLFTFERTTTTSTPAKDNRNVIYFVNPWTDPDTTLQGMSSLSWTNNQLVEADVKIDSQYFTYYISTASSNMQVHAESLFVHELGHVLGLKHLADGTSSVMLQVLNYDVVRDTPTAQDIEDLKCEYN